MTRGQWFPGNMARTVRQLQEDLKLVDLVVELLDARVPASSSNPFLAKLIGGKQRLILLHKSDQGENDVTSRWLTYFEGQGLRAMPFTVQNPRASSAFLNYLKKREENLRRGRIKRPLRLIIVGIPNVGKSTLINFLVNKAVVRTGNRPGITKGRQWIRLLPGVELLDTPGVLQPRLSEETSMPLSVVGALPSSRVDLHSSALWLLTTFAERGKDEQLISRYPGLELDNPAAALEQIGAGLGCLLPEGKIDLQRAAALLLKDYQSGFLGRLSLELPPEGNSVE